VSPVRRLLGAALAVLAAGALVWMTGAPAAAHASLLSTDPGDGAVVGRTPDRIVLTFNEPIRLDAGAVHAFTPAGDDWAVQARAQDNRLVVTPTSDPGKGTVVVAWKVISEDGHEVGGALTFSVGAPSSGAVGGPSAPEPTTVVSAAHWLTAVVAVLALLVLAGVAAVVVAAGRPPGRWTADGLRRSMAWLWDVALVAAVLAVPVEELATRGRGLDGLLDWVVWLEGLTRGRSLLLLAGVLAGAALVAVVGRVDRSGVDPGSRLRRSVSAVLAALCLGAAGTVAAGWSAGSGDPAAATPAQRATTTSRQQADLGNEGVVALTVHEAAGTGVRLGLVLTATDGEPLRPVADPTVTVTSDDVDLGDARIERVGPGRYRATVTIPRDGEWRAQVSVRTSRFDNPVAVVPFTIG
jgi:copper transport protein